jgi:membrane-associated phospholipid phosphatase
MPEHLLQLDRYLFHFINHDLNNPFFDWIMPWLRNPKFWIPLYAFILGFTIWKYKKQGVIIILLLIATVGVADFTSATLIKNVVQRVRPCRDPAIAATVINPLEVGCGTGYSFPSTHATDHFAMALFLILVFCKKWRWIWFWAILWAALISFAQVYVGVHYPIDVTAGALYGSLIGILFALLNKRIQPAFYLT